MKQLLCGMNVHKAYVIGDVRHPVLGGVSVQVNAGEFVSVMGPSGSGKSTLLYALSGMDRIDGGSVTFEGRDLSALSDDALSDLRRTRMGFVFQQPTLLKDLNLLDNIILPLMRDHRRDVGALTQRARELMRRVGIGDLAERGVAQVSGGQLQRAGICRALLCGPRIIFADEPTGALNSKSAAEVMALLSQINAEGTAILLITHDAQIAARTRRVLYMRDGRIVGRTDMPAYDPAQHAARVEAIAREMRRIGI